MKPTIPFSKMVASGNDFVVVDNRKGVIRNALKFAQSVCAWHTGVGADGVLLLENSRRGDFKMRIVNSDGSEAEACGNGFRCIAKYAKEKLQYPSQFRFESLSGLVQAHVNGKNVRVQLPDPKELSLRAAIEVGGNRLQYSFLNTGVPHVVIFVQGLASVDVNHLGRLIREHEAFRPRGTNVNFVEIKNKQEIQVRTYERGVERETMACGTGSTASAILSVLMGFVRAPVRVKTRGGEVLTIDFKKKGNKIQQVMLSGAASFVYEGTLLDPAPSGKGKKA